MKKVLLLILSCIFLCHQGFAQTAKYATAGTGSMRNYISWFDWAGTNVNNGVVRNFTTPDGMNVTVTFSAVSGSVTPYVMNTWSGAVLWKLYDFTDPNIKPALFSQNTTSTVGFTMSISVTRNGSPVPFTFVAADAEASDNTETATLTTSGTAWKSIEFYRNSSQTNNPLTGCGTTTVSITNTYGGAPETGQNPILATDETGSLNVSANMTRTANGGMALAFGIFAPIDRGDLPARYGFAHHSLSFATQNSCNFNSPFPSILQDVRLRLGNIPGDADGAQSTDDNLSGADEDAVSSFPSYTGNGSYTLTLPLFNQLTGPNPPPAFLSGWFDFNRNGNFELNEFASALVNGGTTSATLTWTGLPAVLPAGTINGFAFRFRLASNGAEINLPSGYANGGEAEDYLVPVAAILTCTPPVFDFGFEQNICSPRTVSFNTNAAGMISYAWSFGDAQTNTTSLTPTHTYSNYGDYQVTLQAEFSPGCFGSVTKNIPVANTFDNNVITSADATICAGSSVQLTTTSSFLKSCWTSSSGIPVPSNRIVKPTATTTYYLNLETIGTNLVTNPDFSAGNTGFTSDYVNAQPNVTEGQYQVSNNPPSWNPGLSNCADHTGGGGLMMMVNGSPTPNARIWSQTVAVAPNTNYAFSTWIQSLFPVNYANLKFSINNNIIGNNILAGDVCNWSRFSTTWNSGPATSAVITIVNNNTIAAGNDFAIDDIFFGPIILKNDSVTVTVLQLPPVNTIADASLCAGQSLTLTTTGALNYIWTPAAGLSDPLSASPVATPLSTTTYYVSGTGSNGCTGKDTVTITVVNCPLVTASFSAPDSVCMNTPVTITNHSTGATTSLWNFCVADMNTPPTGVNLGNPGNSFTRPCFMDYESENGNYYGFMISNAPASLVRLNFGNSLLNTPTATNLGNFGGAIPPGAQGIQLVKDANGWHAIITGGDPAFASSRLLKVSFGTSLVNNTPTMTNWGNIGNLSYPTDIEIIKQGSNWYGFTVNYTNSTITRFNFGTSFSTPPTGINLGNQGALNGPSGLSILNDNGTWRIFVANFNNHTLSRIDFGNSIASSPSGATNLGTLSNNLQQPRDMFIFNFCGNIVGYLVNEQNNSIVRLNFSSLTSVPAATTLGNIGGISTPHSISKLFRAGADVFAFVPNSYVNTVSRLKFSGACSNVTPAISTVASPPPVVYNTPGTYNINLTIDEGLETQSSYCKRIVVVPPITHTPTVTYTNCDGNNIRIGRKYSGATYLWNNGATTDSVTVTSPGVYWLDINRYGCSTRDSFIVVACPAASFMAADTICVNQPLSLTNTSTGASTYLWNFCVADIASSPTVTNLGNPSGKLSVPVYMDYALDNGNYYAFVMNHNPTRITRLDFGNSLANTPTAVDLFFAGNPSGPGGEGLQVVFNEGKWYIIIVAGWFPVYGTERLQIISLGTNITNTSINVATYTGLGNMARPIDLHVFKEGNTWYGLTLNAANNTITRFNFSSSFENTPTGVNLGNIGNLSYPIGIHAVNDNGFWRAFITNGIDDTRNNAGHLSRLDFGSSLLNTPTGVNLGNFGNVLKFPMDITVLKSCGKTVAFGINGQTNNNGLFRLDFTNGLAQPPVAVSLGNPGNWAFPHSISKLTRIGNDITGFVPDASGNALTKLVFAGCNDPALPNSNLQHPGLLTYSTPGTYNISLTVDEFLPTQKSYCRQVVVLPQIVHNPTRTFDICAGDSVRIGRSEPFAQFVWSTGETTDSITVKIPGLYWVELNGSKCALRDSFYVMQKPDPYIKLMDDTAVCYGSSFIIRSDTARTAVFSWSPAAGLSDTVSSSPRATPEITTQYIVTARSSNNCIKKDTINITVNNFPVVDIGPDTAICRGDSLLFNVGYAASSYIWQDGTNSPAYWAKDTGLFHVTVTMEGCSSVDSIYLSPNPEPVINVMPDTSVCINSSVRIQTATNGNYTYSWSPATGLSDPAVHSPFTLVSDTVKYILTAVNSMGCKARDSVTLNALPLPQVNLGNDTIVCPSPAVLLDAKNPGSMYAWNNGSNSQMITATAPGLYFVTVTKDGCSNSDSILLSLQQRNFNVAPASAAICKNDTVRLIASGGDVYRWYRNGAALSAVDSFLLVKDSVPAVYSVQVTENRCGYTERLMIPLLIKPSPQVSVTKSNDINCATPRAQLNAKGGVSYKWSPGTDITNDSIANPWVSPVTNTWYKVKAKGINGCSTIDSILLVTGTPFNGNFYVPNAFTPNNDGKNDCIKVRYAGSVNKMIFTIYDRWGALLFQTGSLQGCWDGKYNGILQPNAVYVYYLQVENNCGTVTQKGIITLIR